MEKRPISISVISWILIILGITSLVFMLNIYTRHSNLAESLVEVLTPIQLGAAIVFAIVKIFCAILILKAKHIGRIIYVASALLAFVISSSFSMLLIAPLVLFAVCTFFLFTPKANEYFSSEGVQSPPLEKQTSRTIRNIIAIFFFIVAGFFIFMMGFLSFYSATNPDGSKASFLGLFCIPPLIFYLVGLAFYRGENWKIATGLILLISGSLCLLSTSTILLSMKEVDTVTYGFSVTFGDYMSGFSVIAICISVGILLCLLGRSPDKSS